MPVPANIGYTDDVRLGTWAALVEAGNDTNAPIKPVDEITEAEMDAWWAGFNG